MKNGITLSLIFEATSPNYGEGMGNISGLKHFNRPDGVYSYVSRQALCYNMREQLGWNNTPTEASGSGDAKVVQYHPDTHVDEFAEIDLFGYMKTNKKKDAKTRSAVARVSNAVSMEPFKANLDFLTNMGLARRCDAKNAIAQSEQHMSFFQYTITIDLDRVGVDDNDNISLPDDVKAERVCALLTVIENLYRDIRGRRENMAPVFVIGGAYERKNPYFENRLKFSSGLNLNVDMLKSIMESADSETNIGYLPGIFKNDDEINEKLKPVTVSQFFNRLREEVEAIYAGSTN